MSKRKSGGRAAGPLSPPEMVCILVVDTMFHEFEVEICCQRAEGVDEVFATSIYLNWLRAERPSNLRRWLNSVETLLFGIIARCLCYVGEPVHVRAGLLSKRHVEAIISSVRLEMDEIKKENEVWREAEIVTTAAHLGLLPQASDLGVATWIARYSGQTTLSNCSQSEICSTAATAESEAAKTKLDEFAAHRKEYSWRKNLN